MAAVFSTKVCKLASPDRLTGMVFQFLLSFIVFTRSSESTCHLSMDILTGPLFVDSYERNGILLDTVEVNYSVSVKGDILEMTPCIPNVHQFNSSEIAAHLRTETHLICTILCPSRLKLDSLEGLANITVDHRFVFVHVLINNCTVSTHFLESLVQYFRIYGLILIDTNLYKKRDINNLLTRYDVNLPIGQLTVKRSETSNISVEDLHLDGVQYDATVSLGLIGLGLTELPKNFTSHFPNLQILALGSNNFRTPPSISFVKRITVFSNNVTRTEKMKYNTEYLRELDDAPLNRVPRVLDLTDNLISSIRQNAVHGFIDIIYLSRNQIVNISDGAFEQTHGLECLHLDRNRIKIVTSRMFTGLQTLKTLHLSHNDLLEIHDNAFSDLQNLYLLNLEFNLLTTITRQQLHGLRKLELLALRNNQISEIEKDAFYVVPSLTDINLSSNPLSRIPPELLSLLNLKTLDLSRTGLKLGNVVDALANVPLTILADRLIYRRLPTIALLENGITSVYNFSELSLGLPTFCFDLSKNLLSCDCDMAALLSYFTLAARLRIGLENVVFSWEICWVGWTCHSPVEFRGKSIFDLTPDRLYCPLTSDQDLCPKRCDCFQRYNNSGKVIDCGGRELTELPKIQPDGLLDIRLTNNTLKTVQPRLYLDRIERLYLSYNGLSDFPSSLLSMMVNLTHLHIDHNSLTDFPVLGNHTTLQEIKLGHNLYQCTCDNLWFKTWLIQNKGRVIDWETVSCIAETGVMELVISVTDLDLGCSVITNTALVLTLGFVSLFIFLVFVLLVYFHHELRVFWFIFHTKNTIRSRKSLAGKEFVTSVIFAEDERAWVMDNIIKPLELHFPEWPYSLRFDSFIAGHSMKVNVDHLLQSSVTISVLLSPALLRDEWCMYLLEHSLMLAVQNKTNFVNLIKMPNFPVQIVRNGLLNNYIRLKHYLDSNSKLFKEKVIFSIFGRKLGKKPGAAEICLSHGKISTSDESDNEDVTTFNGNADQFIFDVGIMYGDRDRHWVIHGLLPLIEDQVQKVCLPDRDDIYIPGAADKENIVHLIKSCRIIILVASRDFVSTERCLFTFRAATGKILTNQQQFILLFSEAVDLSALRDLEAYRDTHVCLHKTEEQFIDKLKLSLLPPMSFTDKLFT